MSVGNVAFNQVTSSQVNSSIIAIPFGGYISSEVRLGTGSTLAYGTAIYRSVRIGYSCNSGYRGVAIGTSVNSGTTGAWASIAVGRLITCNNSSSGGIGHTFAFGYNVTCTHGNSMILGQAGATTVANELFLSGFTTINAPFAGGVIHSSDIRDKKDIKDLNIGLSFVKQIRPVTFHWDRREWYPNKVSDGTKQEAVQSMGLIAQEAKDLVERTDTKWTKLVHETNPELLEVEETVLIYPIIKSIHELAELNDVLHNRILQLEARIQSLEASSTVN
jgi:hypothetical protein